MSDELQALIALSEHDQSILDFRKKLKKIPLQITEARKQLDTEQILLDEVLIPWEELEKGIKAKNATIVIALETIAKFEEHMERVNTQKEYMAARKQIDEARKLNERLQNEILAARVKQEDLEPSLKDIRTRYDNVRESFDGVVGGFLKEQKGLERDIDGLEKLKSECKSQLEPQTLRYYERVSKSGMTPALVRVENGVCAGCNISLPPQLYNQLIAEQDHYHSCSHCNRMIYFAPPADEPDGDEQAEQVNAS